MSRAECTRTSANLPVDFEVTIKPNGFCGIRGALAFSYHRGMTNMAMNPVAQKMEQMVSAYFEACRPGCERHRSLLRSRWRALLPAPALRNRGGQFFIDKIFSDVEQWAAAVEWSRIFHQSDRILRGYELYEFDPASKLIREIRGYYAAAPNADKARREIVGFDYEDRGYKTLS